MSVADAHSAEASWSSWLPLCCMPLTSSEKRFGRKSSLNTISTGGHEESWPLPRLSDEELLIGKDEKLIRETVIYDQPLHHPRPTPGPEMSFNQRAMAERAARNNTGPKQRRFLSVSSTSTTHKSHRPTISAPTHFRHISTGTPQFSFPDSKTKAKPSSHKPTISAPTNFRHISTGYPHPSLPESTPTQNPNPRPARLRRRRSFRPLELSIYLPENQVSPILPHFTKTDQLQPPAPVYDPEQAEKGPRSESAPPRAPEQFEKCLAEEVSPSTPPVPQLKQLEDQEKSTSTPDLTPKASDRSTAGSRTLEHQRSFSAMSFHFPRKPVPGTMDSSPSTIYEDEIPPLIPPKARGRPRAHTAPDVDAIKERVASAMIQVEELQKQIDSVIERQSLYSVSRPSTSHSAANTMPELEPMPSIPALPPAAPSFAERLNSEIERPRTAPIKSHVHTHRRARTMDNASPRPFTPPSRTKARRSEIPLPPPLPLVLRPPLRKKKSFSRVSTWLFPGAEKSALDSVTNLPRPVTGKDGFYQCVSQADSHGQHQSDESVGTVTTWNTDDGRTAPSAWSPTSTAVTKGDDSLIPLTATTGGNDMPSPRGSVGVAV